MTLVKHIVEKEEDEGEQTKSKCLTMMRDNSYHLDEALLIMMISKQVLDKKKGFQDVLSETMTLPKVDGNVITECLSRL
jgi:hypothetical protein